MCAASARDEVCDFETQRDGEAATAMLGRDAERLDLTHASCRVEPRDAARAESSVVLSGGNEIEGPLIQPRAAYRVVRRCSERTLGLGVDLATIDIGNRRGLPRGAVYFNSGGGFICAHRTDHVAPDVTAGVVAHGGNVKEHPRPRLPSDRFEADARDSTNQGVGAVPHRDRRGPVTLQPPRHQSVRDVVTIPLDMSDLVAAAPREPDDGARPVVVDGDHDRVGEGEPGQSPPEPAGMPPRRPHPAGELLHSVEVARFRRPHDHRRSLT